MRLTPVLAIVLCLAARDAYAQAPAPTARVVRGVVVRAVDDVPLGRALVTITRDGRTPAIASALTDARGEFSLTVPAEPSLSLRVNKAGYAATNLPIGAGRRGVQTELRIALARGAAIAGRGLDENGGVLGGTMFLTLRRLGPDAGRGAAGVAPPVPVTVTLDDRGEYRIGGLSAGRYALGPRTPGTGNLLAGAGSPREVIVDLTPGSEVAADIVFERVVITLPQTVTPPPAPLQSKGTIRGRVLDTGGQPVAGATVSAKDGARSRVMTTDVDGRFALTDVPTGSVTVDATKSGYVQSRHGAQTSQLPALPITLTNGQVVDGVDIVLPRTSALGGTVVDEAGEPMEDASVQLLRVSRSARGDIVTPASAMSRRTDDRGQFRVWGIVPGTYVIAASAPALTPGLAGSSRVAYPPIYYPATPEVASASQVQIVAEQDLSGFVIAMASVPVARISGVATNSAGVPLSGLIRLSSPRMSALSLQPRQATIGNNGEFVFTDVPRGEYLVQALAASGPSGPEFAAHPVTVVDRDPPALVVRTTPGSVVSGRLVLEGAPDAVLWDWAFNLVHVSHTLSASANAKNSGAFSSGTTFRFSGLSGSARLVFSTPDEKWFLKSINIDGHDVADLPFDFGDKGRVYDDVDVVFSANGASISGRVTDERGAPVQHYVVVVFSADRDKWFASSRWLKMARADADGAFRLTALPPGDYWIAALDRIEGSGDGVEWQDPELLQDLTFRAMRVTLGERQSQTTTLRVIRR